MSVMASASDNASYTLDLSGLEFIDTGPSACSEAPMLLDEDEEETFHDCDEIPQDPILNTSSLPEQVSATTREDPVAPMETVPLADLWGLTKKGLATTPEQTMPLDIEQPSNEVKDTGPFDLDVLIIDSHATFTQIGGPAIANGAGDVEELSDDSETQLDQADADPKQKSSKSKLEDRNAFDQW